MPVVMPVVMTAFGPGRPWEFDLWMNTIKELQLHGARMSCLTNGCSPPNVWRIREWLKQYAGKHVLRHIDKYPNRKKSKPKVVANHIAAMYNTLLSAMSVLDMVDDDWILCLEPDVAPTYYDYTQLLECIAEDVGIVGCAIRSRWSGHRMVYNVKSLDPWRLSHTTRDGTGPTDVHSVSLGCTLIRGRLLRGFQFTGTPNADGSGGAGHEWSLMKHAILTGWRVVCNLDVHPRHYKCQDKWV